MDNEETKIQEWWDNISSPEEISTRHAIILKTSDGMAINSKYVDVPDKWKQKIKESYKELVENSSKKILKTYANTVQRNIYFDGESWRKTQLKVSEGKYNSASEYIRELIINDSSNPTVITYNKLINEWEITENMLTIILTSMLKSMEQTWNKIDDIKTDDAQWEESIRMTKDAIINKVDKIKAVLQELKSSDVF